MTEQGPNYAEALAELDTILDELESADVDVDRLADRVRRPGCRSTRWSPDSRPASEHSGPVACRAWEPPPSR